ncbi:MAG: hypothetical protein E3J72_18830 [Planctomycetota bacterium]|nr:MAG: hypothetical protein E3J72_18830 [Planctomycetota bacterium]
MADKKDDVSKGKPDKKKRRPRRSPPKAESEPVEDDLEMAGGPDKEEAIVRAANIINAARSTEEMEPLKESLPEPEPFEFDRMKKGLFSRFLVVEGMLKDRSVVFEHIARRSDLGVFSANMLIISLVFTAIYGAVMGGFASWQQLGYVAIKLPIVLIATFLVCFPTFYIFNALLGSRMTLSQAFAMLICLTGTTAILLLGFASIALVFTLSTESLGFMVALHIILFSLATLAGFRILYQARNSLLARFGKMRAQSWSFLDVWIVIYTAVGCQIFTYLRPFLTEGPFFVGKRQLFLEVFKELAK